MQIDDHAIVVVNVCANTFYRAGEAPQGPDRGHRGAGLPHLRIFRVFSVFSWLLPM
jgi:hypothetical protein